MNNLKAILVGILLIAAFDSNAQEFPKVIFPGDYPDPSILRDGKDFYMTHSSFSYSPGFLVWHSQDLINWKPISRANGAGMAPDLVKYGDIYYIYYPWGSTNYVVWAKEMKGPWSKPIDLHVKGIDPGHIVDENGNRYLHLSEGTAVRLSKDGLSVVGAPITVYEGWQYPKDWNTECFCLESPKLTQKDGYYYLTSAEGGTAGPATSHMAVSARSKNIMGPWENSPYNPVVHTYSADEEWWSKGHATIFDDANGDWWIIYHAYKKNFHTLGRSTLLEPIEWTADGWFKTKRTAKLPGGSRKCMYDYISDISDDFRGEKINIRWTTFGSTPQRCTSVKDGWLEVTGKGDSPERGRLLLAIPAHEYYEAQVEVELQDAKEAGLLLFYKPKAFVGITFDSKNIRSYTAFDDYSTTDNEYGNRLCLKIVNDHNICSFWASRNGENWKKIASGIDVSKLNHNNYNGFRALRIALYVGGKGKAKFCKFKYLNQKMKL